MTEIKNKIYALVASKAGIEIEEINDNSSFSDDLNLGEMEILDIITEIEEMYEITLEVDTEDLETVGDLISAVSEELN